MINIFIVYNIIGVIHLVALFYKLSSKGGISYDVKLPYDILLCNSILIIYNYNILHHLLIKKV
jgi:hypothetical protein